MKYLQIKRVKSLNGKIFFETLKEFGKNYPELLNFINEREDITEEATYFALDLSPSKQKILDDFFDSNNNEFDFAKRYIEKISNIDKVPTWIEEIKNLY